MQVVVFICIYRTGCFLPTASSVCRKLWVMNQDAAEHSAVNKGTKAQDWISCEFSGGRRAAGAMLLLRVRSRS